jgi:hypothetical protein
MVAVGILQTIIPFVLEKKLVPSYVQSGKGKIGCVPN